MSVIRRKHTKHFTTIGNELFDDERLQADELGLMSYLLSRSNGWEVRRHQLCKRFKFGRERMQRIMWNLVATGWIVAVRDRREAGTPGGGTVTIEYEVRDEPGPEIPLVQVKAAFRLSADADEDSTTVEDTEEAVTAEPLPAESLTGQPLPGNPSRSYYKDLPNTESPKTELPIPLRPPQAGAVRGDCIRDRKEGSGSTKAPSFDEMLARYPSGHCVSIHEAQRAWRRLSAQEQRSAIDLLTSYLAACGERREIRDLKKYLRGKCWQGLEAKKPPDDDVVQPGTERARALLAAPDTPGFIKEQLLHGKPVTVKPAGWQAAVETGVKPMVAAGDHRPCKRTVIDAANDMLARLHSQIAEAEARERAEAIEILPLPRAATG